MNGGNGVDPEVRRELAEIEKRLSSDLKTLVTSAIASGFKDVKDVITELFNKDIGYLREWQDTFKGYHKTHFAETIKLRNEITGAREALSKEFDEKMKPLSDKIESLGTRQTVDEITAGVTEKVKIDKQNMSITKITIGLTVASGAGAFIMWLIGFIVDK